MDHLNIDFKPMIAPTSMMTYIVDLDAYECHGGGGGMKKSSTTFLMNARVLYYTYDMG